MREKCETLGTFFLFYQPDCVSTLHSVWGKNVELYFLSECALRKMRTKVIFLFFLSMQLPAMKLYPDWQLIFFFHFEIPFPSTVVAFLSARQIEIIALCARYIIPMRLTRFPFSPFFNVDMFSFVCYIFSFLIFSSSQFNGCVHTCLKCVSNVMSSPFGFWVAETMLDEEEKIWNHCHRSSNLPWKIL